MYTQIIQEEFQQDESQYFLVSSLPTHFVKNVFIKVTKFYWEITYFQ